MTTTMVTTLKTVILPGGRIEISSPELIPGHKAKILVMMDEARDEKMSLSEILRDYPGGQLFKTSEEVDTYIREERAAWDR